MRPEQRALNTGVEEGKNEEEEEGNDEAMGEDVESDSDVSEEEGIEMAVKEGMMVRLDEDHGIDAGHKT